MVDGAMRDQRRRRRAAPAPMPRRRGRPGDQRRAAGHVDRITMKSSTPVYGTPSCGSASSASRCRATASPQRAGPELRARRRRQHGAEERGEGAARKAITGGAGVRPARRWRRGGARAHAPRASMRPDGAGTSSPPTAAPRRRQRREGEQPHASATCGVTRAAPVVARARSGGGGHAAAFRGREGRGHSRGSPRPRTPPAPARRRARAPRGPSRRGTRSSPRGAAASGRAAT